MQMLSPCIRIRSSVISKSVVSQLNRRTMATIRTSLPHEDRTAQEPRDPSVHSVILANIREVNENIRLLRLNATDPNRAIKVHSNVSVLLNGSLTDTVKFLPGQWLDTFIPGLQKAGYERILQQRCRYSY